MIDTGFTGFLLMPMLSAFPIGLTLYGTSKCTLADGRTGTKLLALGSVRLEGEDTATVGLIILEKNNCGLLLGMDYLRKSKRSLVVSEQGVILLDEAVVSQVVSTFTQHQKARETSSEAPRDT
jgi:predicted aspartyl protease